MNKFDYSTNEQVIGIWTDDKPIYQKTFPINVTLQGSRWSWYGTGIIASDYNIDKIIDAELVTNIGMPHFALGYHLTHMQSISILSYMDGTNITYMTLRYTKTTD